MWLTHHANENGDRLKPRRIFLSRRHFLVAHLVYTHFSYMRLAWHSNHIHIHTRNSLWMRTSFYPMRCQVESRSKKDYAKCVNLWKMSQKCHDKRLKILRENHLQFALLYYRLAASFEITISRLIQKKRQKKRITLNSYEWNARFDCTFW